MNVSLKMSACNVIFIAKFVLLQMKYQHPIAAVLGCMDSRAPTEMIFDVGIGDLFSLRIAGNIAGQRY